MTPADAGHGKCQIPETVQGTNDCSILSKFSAACSGYFEDNFLRVFVSGKSRRRSPLINRGYYIRFKAITDVLHWFVNTGGPTQIVSLGAGFDTAYFRIKSSFGDAKFFEVDFPDLVARKARLIVGSRDLCSAIGPFNANSYSGLSATDYKLIGADLRDLAGLDSALRSCGLDFAQPTLLLSECVLTYMDPTHSTDLIAWAAHKFDRSTFVTYEQIYPFDAFGLVMRRHFDKLQSPLRGIALFPDRESQERRYREAGFTHVASCTMLEYFRNLQAAERQRVRRLEPFDEYDEWQLKCGHYFTLTATNDARLPPLPRPVAHQAMSSTQLHAPLLPVCTSRTAGWSAYGHSVATLPGSSLVLTVGGFGMVEDRHSKLSGALALDCFTGNIVAVHCHGNLPSTAIGGMYSSLTDMGDGSLLLLGGRRSPVSPCSEVIILTPFVLEGESSINLKAELLSATGDLPSPRWRHTVTQVVSPQYGSQLVLFGGRNVTEVLGDCYVMTRKIWRLVVGHRVGARHSHACSALAGGRLVLYGGLDDDEQPLADVWSFDTLSCQWTELTMLRPLPNLFSHTLHAVGDDGDDSATLVAIGGIGELGLCHSGVMVANLSSGLVADIPLADSVRDCDPFMWHNHESVVLGDSIFVLGGGGNCFSFGTHLNSCLVRLRIADILTAISAGCLPRDVLS